VIGMSELLLETQLMPLQREYAATVKESAQALLAIIDDILDFSKLEANKVEIESVAFDPAQLIASAINLARGTARDKGLTLYSVASPHVPSAVRGDPTRVRQVLINLIGNAVKFTPAGEIGVSCTVERDDGHALILAFAVSDTGIGVIPEARDRLFEAFVQGDGSTTRRFGGTGLGLSISRRLVELMGGRIWLGEHAGPGSTFCFTARFERTSEIVAPIALPAGALRVLVLDDDGATRRTFEATLASWGMHHASCADIDSAHALLREAALNGTPFDVVLIDYVLPRSDGLAFARELAERPEYGNPARILMTAFDADGRKQAALDSGCADFLLKPVDPSDLFDALGRLETTRKARALAGGRGLARARILMAEDSALIRRVARFQVEELDFAVDIVENGLQAVEAVSAGTYELVLMDMRMPEMDGLAATRAIRESERSSGRHIVIVALTANVLDGDREACVEAGMDDFLAKPLKLDELRTVLDRWLPEPAAR
jgi:two-component system sensor histidine kinase/response regulator